MKKRRSGMNPAKTYRISPEAIAAIENLSIAFDQPRGKVMEYAILRLQDEWRARKVKGIGVIPAEPLSMAPPNGRKRTHS